MATKQPVLIVIQGPEPGSLYKLPDHRVTTIGRSSRNTIRAVSSGVSRFHCEVSWVNARWQLNDLNSRHGTIVNGKRIADRCILQPGDIIRISSSVFRFDMIDETAIRDGAIVAIMEAELDQRLLTKGEAAGTLEDIRARSRLEGEHVREERESERRTLKPDLLFVAAVAIAVGAVVAGALGYAHKRTGSTQDKGDQGEQTASALYEEAAALLKAGSRIDGLQGLSDIERRFPDTKAARQAAQARLEALWAEAQEKLLLIARHEADGDYAAALDLYEGLTRLHPDKLLEGLLEQRRQYTVRLAYASFKSVERIAQQHVGRGNRRAALDLYRRAKDRIGVPDLVAQAEAKAAELEKGLSPR